jgi:hypothetical protein
VSQTVKRLVTSGELQHRATSAERMAHLDEDVPRLIADLRRNLTDKSAQFTGWTLDGDSWEAAVNGRTVILFVTMRNLADRPDARSPATRLSAR